jgi:anti-sigma-K factor RskA
MNREQTEELASLDALGALDGDDLSAWRRLGAEDNEAVRLRDELSAVAMQLCALAPRTDAPAALKLRVMDRVFGVEPGGTATQSPRHSAYSAWAAAAAIVLLALAGASSVTRLKESVVVRDARPGTESLFIPLEGYGDFAAAKGSVLWDSGQRGWFVQAAGLPELPASHRYRVWAVCAEGGVHDCGELPLRGNGLARRFVQPGDGIDSMQGFAVSVEPAGSAPAAPTSPAVLISAGLRS